MSFYKNIHNILTPKDYEEVLNGDNVHRYSYGYIGIETHTIKNQILYVLNYRHNNFIRYMFIKPDDMLDIYNTCKSYDEYTVRITKTHVFNDDYERDTIVIENVRQKLYDPTIIYLEVMCIDPKEL